MAFLFYCLLEGVLCEAAVFCMIMIDLHTVHTGVSLKRLLFLYLLFLQKSSLQVHVGQITIVIQEDCCRTVMLLGGIALELGY